tara:strand:+ start:1958 stop:2158 length:201 start_codon:yes stop_codon:yes gene_type:complete
MKKQSPAVVKAADGVVGANALWDGPLNTMGFPMGRGSSSGITGMQLKKASCAYKSGPITQLAKSSV